MAGKGIKLISGFVEINSDKKLVPANFVDVLVIGDTEDEIRRNFRYSRAFLGSDAAKDRKRFEKLEEAGKVRLVSFVINKQVGVTNE